MAYLNSRQVRAGARLATGVALTAFIAGVALPVQGQDRERQNEDQWYDPTDWFDDDNNDNQYFYEEQDRDQQYRQRQEEQQRYRQDYFEDSRRYDSQQQQQRQQFGQVSPDAMWVRVAYDFNNDGQFDAFEYIYMSDLDQARRSTQARIDRDMQNAQRETSDRPSYYGTDDPWAQQQQQGQQRQQNQLSGEIDRISSMTVSGETHAVAQVRTDEGRTVKVDLGPRDKLSQLNLNEQDRITAYGSHDFVQGEQVFKADRLMANGQSITIQSSQFGQQQQQQQYQQQAQDQISGEVDRVTTTTVTGETHLVAEIRTTEGRTMKVDLGPREKVSNLRLEEGDNLTVFGSQDFIQGERMFKAQHVLANGQSIMIDKDQPRGGYYSTDQPMNLRTIEGEIASKRTADFRNHPESHVVLSVRTFDNQTAIVDLGPESDLRNIDLNEGDRITLQVESVRINGEPAYAAHEVEVNGNRVRIDRQEDLERARQQQRQNGQQNNTWMNR